MKMISPIFSSLALASLFIFSSCATGPVGRVTQANTSASTIATNSKAALDDLCRGNAAARQLRKSAAAVLVFPNITKGGFVVGGMGGNGTMYMRDGSVGGYYQTGGVSYGLQAGIQKYGYALFLMDAQAIRNLNASGGWEIGGAPSLVVVDQGIAGSLTTTTAQKSVYAFFFSQKGLMGGLGLQGTKITRINPGS